MEKITISPAWTTEERDKLHALILKEQEGVDRQRTVARGLDREKPCHEKLRLQARSYNLLLVLLKDDYSAQHLQKNRGKFEEFIFV